MSVSAISAEQFNPDDLSRLPDGGQGFELVRGELKERHKSFRVRYVAGTISTALSGFVRARGWLVGSGVEFRCFPVEPGRVRRADTAFHRLDRLTATQATAEGHCTVVPDLVVEVVSPNDLADDVNAKRVEWLEAGAPLVWLVYPVQQQVHAFAADGTVRVFGPQDVLTADPVVPGFSVPVADLFRLPTAGA